MMLLLCCGFAVIVTFLCTSFMTMSLMPVIWHGFPPAVAYTFDFTFSFCKYFAFLLFAVVKFSFVLLVETLCLVWRLLPIVWHYLKIVCSNLKHFSGNMGKVMMPKHMLAWLAILWVVYLFVKRLFQQSETEDAAPVNRQNRREIRQRNEVVNRVQQQNDNIGTNNPVVENENQNVQNENGVRLRLRVRHGSEGNAHVLRLGSRIDHLEERLCAVCFEEERNVAVFPCGHTQVCETCIRAVRRTNNLCPICQQRIRECRSVYV